MSGHPTLRTKLRRDIRRQWPQFAALVLAVLLGVALFAASYDAYRNLRASYAGVFVDQRFADLFVTGSNVDGFARQAATTDGVAAVTTRTQADLPFAVGRDKLLGRVVGYPASGDPAVDRLTLLSGHGLSGPDTALVEHHMAEHFGLGPGDTVTVVGAGGPQQLRVVGVVASAEYLWPARSRQDPITSPDDFGVVFAPQATVQALAGATAPNQVLVRLKDGGRAGDLLGQLSTTAVTAGATQVLTRDEQPSNALLNEDINGFQEMAVAFPLLFLSAAALSIYVLLTRRVAAERPIIGMLRAQGMRRRTIGVHYLSYGLVAGLIGSTLGVLIGSVGARVLSGYYVRAIDLPAQSAVLVTVRPFTILAGLVFGIGVGALAALAPALLASRVPPAEAMREEPAAAGHGTTLLERLIPPLRRLPARWRMVLRGADRNRRRTVFTATGMALALILVLVSWTMIDSMNALLHRQFDVVATADAQVQLAGPVTSKTLATLTAVDDVRTAEPLVQQPVAVVSGGRTYATVLSAFVPRTTMHTFLAPGGREVALPSDGILVGQSLRGQLGVRPGDEVTLRLPALGRDVRARIAGFVDEPLGTFVYASATWLRSVAGDVPATSALLAYEPGTDPAAVRQAVSAVPGVVAYTDTQALARAWSSYAGLFWVVVLGMLVLGGLMAFAIVFTTMSVNIMERRREIATLRAAGVRHRVLARLITEENLLVALLGVIPGLLLGVAAGAAFLKSFSSDQFTLTLVVRPLTLLLTTLALLLVVWLSQWPGLRALRRMDLAEVVRERTG